MANTSRIKLDDSAIKNIAENTTLQNELNLSSDDIANILKNLNNNGAGKSSLFYIAFTGQKDNPLTKIAKEIVKHLRVEKITENGEVIVLDKNNDELDITGITIKGNGKITYINGAKFLANQPSIPFIDKKETTGFNQLNVKFINSLIEFHKTYPDKDMEICFVNEKNMDLSPHKKSAGEQSISNVLDEKFYFDESKNKNNYFFDKPIRVLPLINSLFNENNQLKKDFFEKNNLSSKRFDFFVENSLIEYDGIQHFVSKPGDFGSKTFFKDTIKRYSGDLAKNLFAYNSNIPLLRLPVELYPPEKYAEWEDRAEEYKRKITGVIVYFIKTGRVPENIIEYYEKYGGIAGKVYAKHARLMNERGFNINGENNGKSINAESIRELINSKTSGEKNEKIKNILKEPQNWTAGAYSELEKLALDEKDTTLNLNDIINAVSKMEKIKKDDVVKTDKIEKDKNIDEAVEYLNALNKINESISLKRNKWSESQYEDKIFFNNNNNNNNNNNKISVKIERNGSGVLLDMIDAVVVPIKNATATKNANAEKEALNRVTQFIEKMDDPKKTKEISNFVKKMNSSYYNNNNVGDNDRRDSFEKISKEIDVPRSLNKGSDNKSQNFINDRKDENKLTNEEKDIESNEGDMIKMNGVEIKKPCLTLKYGKSATDIIRAKDFDTYAELKTYINNIKSYSTITYVELSGIGQDTDASNLFRNCKYLKAIDASKLDTSNVTDMRQMFASCKSLESLDVSNFDTSNVIKMDAMFAFCKSLTSLNVSNFNTSNVTDMRSMFYNCESLTSLDVSNFDTSNVTDMSWMFAECISLESLDVSRFNTSNVTDMNNYIFYNCKSLDPLSISNLYTSNKSNEGDVIKMNNVEVKEPPCLTLKYGASATDIIETKEFDTYAKLKKYLYDILYENKNVTYLKLSGISQDTDANASSLFEYGGYLNTIDVSELDTSNIEDMSYMFNKCKSLNSLDVSNFDTSKVWTMQKMFAGCESLTSLNVSNFDTSNVEDMSGMFGGCKKLRELNVSELDTSNVKNMKHMFNTCKSLTSLDVSSFDTSNVKDMGYMFNKCESLNSLDVSNFNASNVKNKEDTIDSMFKGCNENIEITFTANGDIIGDAVNCLYKETSTPVSKIVKMVPPVKKISEERAASSKANNYNER